MKTIITHFYNEEYLLPWWLNHHKKYFNHGILINYGSTDRSVEIIKEICPTWEIVDSKHEYFDHNLCDREVEQIELQIDGWRTSIPVTEFLVGNLDKLMYESNEYVYHFLPVLIFTGYQPDGYIDNTKPLWHQITQAIPYEVDKASRSLQNFKYIGYLPGRHFWGLANTDEAMIFKYSSCLIGPEMIKRRLQVQDKVSQNDRELRVAEHHVYSKGGGLTIDNLHEFYKENVLAKNPVDCSEYIYKYNLKERPNRNYITSTIINNLPNIEKYTYLELGIGNGLNFKSIKCSTKMSVDITPNISVFTGTTDEYFSKLKDSTKFDIIFIDANHDIDYALRDFNNAVDHGNKWIILDDTIPKQEYLTQSVFCGDSYKLLYYMLKYTNFQVYPVDHRDGLTLVKLPAGKIELNEETKNLLYSDFINFMSDKKIYNTVEIENMLKNCF